MIDSCIGCGFSGSRDDCDVEEGDNYTAYLCPECSGLMEYDWEEGDDGYTFSL